MTEKATCEKAGEKTFACKVCGAVKTETIPATGHAYGDWTELDENEHQRVCANDASHVENAAHNWDNGRITKEAQRGVEGEKTFTCKDCGAIRTETIEALPVLPDSGRINAYVNQDREQIEFFFWMLDEDNQPVSIDFDLELTIRCNDYENTEMYSVSKKVAAEEIRQQVDPSGVERLCYILDIPFDALNLGRLSTAKLECKMTIESRYYFEWKDAKALSLEDLPYLVIPKSAGRTGYFDDENEKIVLFVFFRGDEFGSFVASDADFNLRIVNDDGTETYNGTIAVFAKDFKTQNVEKPLNTGNPDFDNAFGMEIYSVRIEIPYSELTAGIDENSMLYTSVSAHSRNRVTLEYTWEPEAAKDLPL